MSRLLLVIGLASFIASFSAFATGLNTNLEDPYSSSIVSAPTDTIPDIKDRYGDHVNDPNQNPFDLKDPSSIEKTIDYDPISGNYIINEKIGDFDFRPTSYMSFDEYLEWRKKKEERDYFNRLAGINPDGENPDDLDPIAKFDVESTLLDRLFGGTTVDIRPQGNIDLTFGVDFQRVENPILTERQRTQGGFDFDMNIQMNVTGKIGEKLNLTTNYNTNATFDFDNQIKLDYNSDLFSEDEIIKKIEAGNVSLPLRGTLIQGAQSLFGIKTELQFGHLRLTAIASQQRSQRENLQIQGGAQVQEFEVRADEYDENRHFFLSHYNRDAFEGALTNLPQIKSLFRIENLEVWITNDRNEVENVRDIVAIADLGEPEFRNFTSVNTDSLGTPKYREICDGRPLPDNGANGLYEKLINTPNIREIDQTVSTLQSSQFGYTQAKDFEKVSARKLTQNEYTFNPDLGFISLNINVRPDQVLGVSFQYTYNGQTFKVGELANNVEGTSVDTTLKVLFVKMLKSTTQRTDVSTWDLMMKNVYSIGAFQVNQEDFKLDIFYEDPGKGDKRFLPTSSRAGEPLLRLFNLDILNVQGDPQPDGVFDFVPGVTINPRNGRIMFPVLEPFGRSLQASLERDGPDQEAVDEYVFEELYTKTIFQAQEIAEDNRFVIRGQYKSSVSNEISLGAFNIPPGSVNVSAGGQILREGTDYEVDYNIGRVRILNDAILESGVPVNVSFEDNTLFGFQTKTMLGLRADYSASDNFNIGATFLQLFERPFTQKVNIGDDPINNRIYGLDMNISQDAPWLTRAVDAIPLISTDQPSSIAFTAETAILQPGHSRAINQNSRDRGGVVYVDDFEGSNSSFDLRQPSTNWFLASVPQNEGNADDPSFPEAQLVNDIRSGVNRARLNWYRIDPSARSTDAGDNDNPYTSRVEQQEVFPNLQLTPDQLPNIQTLDLAFHPNERGPYNFDIPNGYAGYSSGTSFIGDSMVLNDPETRWGGIMRALNTNDFQTANIEFLEFWMLSPFLNEDDPLLPADNIEEKQGKFYINLGNISEDILRDSRKFFENGLPAQANPNRRVDTTSWSIVPTGQQITRAFDNDPGAREVQDVGLDGMDNETERTEFVDFLNAVRVENPNAADKLELDPAGDDFRYFRDPNFGDNDGVLKRYRQFNNPQGNSQANDNNNTRQTSTNIPDAEDLNRDNTLNETESYFQYEIPLYYDPSNPREILQDSAKFITDRRVSSDGERIWYRFRIPLTGDDKKAIGGIQDFRSIRFIRMFMQGFRDETVLRFARLELVRNQWRRYTRELVEGEGCINDNGGFSSTLDVDAVNIEENSGRFPFNYVLPEGIQREQSVGVFNALQNEQSLSLKVNDLCKGANRTVFKNVNIDMRVYKRLKMFVHAESLENMDIPDGDVSIFVRLGSDVRENYYEYEIPLTMSDEDNLNNDPNSSEYKQEVWRPENEFDFPLDSLVLLKRERNKEDFSLGEEFIRVLGDPNDRMAHTIRIKGNPNIGFVKIAMIGIRHREDYSMSETHDVEIWANELRLTGLDERGGWAATARMDMQLADFGNLTFAGNYSSIGFGALDQKVAERSRENVYGFDVAGNLELGKFFPEDWGLRFPFYAQYSQTVRSPEFDPYDLDVKLEDKINDSDPSKRDSIRAQAQEVQTIRSYNFTNVRKERKGGGSSKPWNIENFSVNYGYQEIERSDPIIELDRQERYSGGLDYNFTRKVKYIEPFKNLFENDKYTKLISDFNFNPLPNSFSFSTVLDRRFARTSYRFTGLEERFNTFFNKSFTWGRDYNLQWDLTRTLKVSFNANNASVIDEPDEVKMLEDPTITNIEQFRSDSIWTNIRNLGRTKNYRHNINVSYNVPLKNIPFIGELMTLKAQYQGSYNWTAAALNTDSLGNIIQNSQNRQVNLDLNFEKLYNSIPYIKDINRGGKKRRDARRQRNSRNQKDNKEKEEEADDGKKKKKKRSGPSAIERALIRPLLLVRRARFNYSEQFRTSVPGFMPEAKLLGQNTSFSAPGWGFVAGLQPRIRELSESEYGSSRDWLYQSAQDGYITQNVFLNQEVIQDYTQNYDIKVTLEPFKDFRIDLEANRSFTENHTQYFKILDKENIAGPGEPLPFEHAIPKNVGSMTVSYNGLSTFFDSGIALWTQGPQQQENIRTLFQQFESNRVAISQRIGTGQHENTDLAELGYTEGYGRVQQDVLIPAFIAAYSGQDASNVDLNLFDILPKVNWRLTYNGLSKLDFFKEIFQNFNLTHGYKSTLTVNTFNTGLDFLRSNQDPEFGSINPENGNFYARLEIPEVGIAESFSPLIAVDAQMKNGMSFNVDYKKSRILGMSFINNQLNESQSEELVLGFGYLLRDVEFGFLKGKKNKKRKKDEEEQKRQNQNQRNNRRGGGNQLQGRDLDINFSFSLRDDVTFAHRLDEGVIEPTRGTYSLSISPSAEYKINKSLSLRLFFDYRRNVPKTSAGFPRTDTSGGVVVRFQLN
ncbi:MAG: cell surface protein SprA [Saprospiraceae bacterium]|nr:cell surface protein SprA [Saprospiraceae bacterium]